MARRNRSATVIAAAMAAGVLACGDGSPRGGTDAAVEGSIDGTAAMAARLTEIARDADPRANVFLNARRVAVFRGRPLPEEEPERTAHELTIGRELLNAGRTEEAVETLEATLRRLRTEDDGSLSAWSRAVRSQLAIARLRLGEQRNCVEQHNPEACLLPIRGRGVHRDRAGAEAAAAIWIDLLEEEPRDLEARWLLNLAAMALGEHPESVPERWLIEPEVFDDGSGFPRFPDAAAESGLAVSTLAGGSVVEDLTGDGALDVMVSSWGLGDPLVLLRNLGDGSFEDVTAASGLDGITGGLNLVPADYDNDGRVDVLVLRGAWLGRSGLHPNSLLKNLGDGRFADVTEAAGVLSFRPTQTAAWGDFDNDGWLDLFIGNESAPGSEQPCELFRNEGDGTFTEMAAAAGVDVRGIVKGVAWGDYDDDGWLDLYVSRLRAPNVLLRNEAGAEGRAFRDVTATAGVGAPTDGFPTWFWDYDQDGCLDLFAAAYDADFLQIGSAAVAADFLGMRFDAEPPRLYRNRCDGTFEDVTWDTGLVTAMYAMGSGYGDLDNDGYPDFYVGTGAPDYRSLVPNRMFRNVGGERFEEVTFSGGFGHLQKGHGVSFADIDEDGDQDVHITLGGAYEGDVYPNALFRNPGNGAAWVTLALEGVSANRTGLGARLRLSIEGPGVSRVVHAVVGPGGSFGASPSRAELGLGTAETIHWVEVAWPGGAVERFSGVAPRGSYRLRQGEGTAVPVVVAPGSATPGR